MKNYYIKILCQAECDMDIMKTATALAKVSGEIAYVLRCGTNESIALVTKEGDIGFLNRPADST